MEKRWRNCLGHFFGGDFEALMVAKGIGDR